MEKREQNKKLQVSLWQFIAPDKKLLVILTIAGIIFNVGLVFIPIFEGWLAQCLYDIIKGEKVFADMLELVGIYVLTMMFVQLSRYFKRLFVRTLANNMTVRMREVLYLNILNKKRTELENSVGELVTRASQDVEAVAEGTRKTVTEIFDTGVLLVSYGITMFIYDWKIALVALIFTPIACVIAELLKKLIYKEVSAYKLSAEKLSNATYERVTASQLFRVNGRDKDKNAQYENYLLDYQKKAIRANVYENTLQPVYNVIAMIGVIFIIYWGGRNVLGVGTKIWDIAVFSTFISCYAKVADKSSKVAKLFNSIQKAGVSWKRLKPNLYPIKDEFDHSNANVSSNEKVKVSVQNLSFAYPNAENVLSNVNFKCESGMIVGVTGSIASGKSTLGKVFLMENEYNGSVKINGVELSSMTDGERFGYVSYLGHNPELFSFSIKENVCMGSEIDANEFLKTVCIDKEISEMEGGINANVGAMGVRLSGGQQARVALARTLAHAKSVIILDDPFSAVDKKTEAQILNNLKEKFNDRLIIIISHRLTAFPNFNKVLWIDGGKVVESSHEQLMRTTPLYKKLFELQTEMK